MNAQVRDSENFNVYNYCISFIDLLGQRDALRGQGLVPAIKTEEEKQQFNKILKTAIGAIYRLQRDAESMLNIALAQNPNSPLRESLFPADQAMWDEMQRTRVTTQRWSDGLVFYVCLGDSDIRCHMNGIFSIFTLAGSLCFMGLGRKQPIRGAIDIAWGTELRPGELYGPAVARAYELESEWAQYPRIVVSQQTARFLEAVRANVEQDYFSRFNRAMAELCLGMLIHDADGLLILHYLGETYIESVSKDHHVELYKMAHTYVVQQCEQHRSSRNTKLAFRYVHLMGYFDAHPPPSVESAT